MRSFSIRRFTLVVVMVLFAVSDGSLLCGQGLPANVRALLTGGNPGTAYSLLPPGDLLAGPQPLQGSSALGVCLVPEPNPWGTAAVIVVDIFTPQSWVYDAVTLAPVATIANPAGPGSTTTGITTDGTQLFWGVFSATSGSQLWQSDLDGNNPQLIANMALQGGGFVGGLAWNGADAIWAVDITGDRYDLISMADGSYLGESTTHPDGTGPGNGVAWRSDCNRLEIPHGPVTSSRVTSISCIDPTDMLPLAPIEVASSGFFINGIESSASPAAQGIDLFGIDAVWLVDNSSNSISVVEGRNSCPGLLPPLDGVNCTTTVDGNVEVSWIATDSVEIVEIRIDGILVGSISGSSGQWSGTALQMPDVITVQICGHSGDSWTPTQSFSLVVPGCSSGPLHLSHLAEPDLINSTTPVCGTGSAHEQQSYWRTFDVCDTPFSLSTGLILESIRLAVEYSDPGPGMLSQPLIFRIHVDPDGGDIAPASQLILLHEQEVLVPPLVQQHLCLNLDVPLEVDCQTPLVVEIELPDGTLDENLFILGSNSSGESSDGWFSSAACNLSTPSTLTSLGYPDTHIAIDLIGSANSSPFIRGDANGDGSSNLTDSITILGSLFSPGGPPLLCRDAADCNDDGGVNLADAIYLLSYLFIPGFPAPPPPTVCGADPTPLDPLGCQSDPSCP